MGDINYIGSIPLGRVHSFRPQKTAQIIPVPTPTQDSSETQAYDVLGVVAYIDIEGVHSGNFETIMGYQYDIFNLIDGNQDSSVRLLSPFVCLKYTGGVRKQGNISVTTSGGTNLLVDTSANFDTWGTTTNDYVMNLNTREMTTITSVSATQLGIASMTLASGTPYAVTAHINVKVLDFIPHWQTPGLTYCRYTLKLLQVE